MIVSWKKKKKRLLNSLEQIMNIWWGHITNDEPSAAITAITANN